MAKNKRAYFGLEYIISLILAIIPFTNVLLGIITRILRGKYLGALLNLIIAPLFYIIDLVTIIIKKDVTVLA
ncbi:MAG: hypothetical protein PHI19_05815 [Clostridia bacterium]|nr:hypothetical protein [Clostridia bacterium]